MKLTIDNLDGLGAVDYSAAIDASQAVKIERTLNAPSIVTGLLCLEGSGLAVPARRGRVVLTADAGAVLFTGYLATEPVGVYAGVASEGPVYRLAFSAVSDEWLLDKQAPGWSVGVALGEAGGTVVERLLSRLDPGVFTTGGVAAGPAVGVFIPEPGAGWSGLAGAAANATYASYRVLNGALTLTPAGSVVHALSDGDGTLSVAGLKRAAVRELANDVTVSGAMEPTVYWNELFVGDGTTTEFDLAGQPDAPGAGHAVLLDDGFTGSAFNLQTWAVTDPGSHFSLSGGSLSGGSLSGGGLTMSGGNGVDGQTTFTAIDPVEIGGTVTIELAGVTLGAGSAGVLGGLYAGPTLAANCFAGFNVQQSGGSTVIAPMVNGLVTGTAYTLLTGHSYTLRLRLHSPEMLRVRQSYYALVDGAVEQFGAGLVDAGAALVFEVRDLGNSSNTPATVLYDGRVGSAPAQASFVAANSVQLIGSVAAVVVTRTGSAWVVSTAAGTGTPFTGLIGKASDGADCSVSSSVTGKVTFFAGRVPAAGETVSVQYRGSRRAVARLADAASLAVEAAGGSVGTARWVGKVLRPEARCTADCESAAQAILSFATNRAAAATGTYKEVNPANGDVWPGDLLALTQNGSSVDVVVRRVTVEEQGASPEALTYRISFANDWAEALGVQLSDAIAKDALLPALALELPAGASAPVLANLQQLAVTPSGGTSLTVDAGVDAPAGGGFEVRRHDGGFGSGAAGSASGDLVLRSPVRGFSIPRAAFQEQFFVRMYDASTPPLYSRESSGISTNLPVG